MAVHQFGIDFARLLPSSAMNFISKRSNTMTTENLAALKPAAVVDCRGSACPGPLMEAKKAIGKVKVGEVLEVLSNDPGTKNDIPLWAKKVGHECLGALAADGYDRIFVTRKK
jgi:tRNA 2-thiouridine synthesizing protein A